MTCARLSLVAVLVVFSIPLAAGVVGITVDDSMAVETRVLSEDHDQLPATWTVEVQNTGSGAVAGQISLTVRHGNETVHTAWTAPLVLDPGSMASRTMAFDKPNITGNVTASIVFHYGTEHKQVAERTFSVESRSPQNGFNIDDTVIRNGKLRFSVTAPESVDQFAVWTSDDSTRRFVQRIVTRDRSRTTVTVPQYPAIDQQRTVDIFVASMDGRYHTAVRRTVDPHRTQWYNRLVDTLFGWTGS